MRRVLLLLVLGAGCALRPPVPSGRLAAAVSYNTIEGAHCPNATECPNGFEFVCHRDCLPGNCQDGSPGQYVQAYVYVRNPVGTPGTPGSQGYICDSDCLRCPSDRMVGRASGLWHTAGASSADQSWLVTATRWQCSVNAGGGDGGQDDPSAPAATPCLDAPGGPNAPVMLAEPAMPPGLLARVARFLGLGARKKPTTPKLRLGDCVLAPGEKGLGACTWTRKEF